MLVITGIIALLLIWGVDQSRLVVFITSLLTILGIAFFAQWSLISNITSTLVVYFNHPAKIGDTITVFDKNMISKGRFWILVFFLSLFRLWKERKSRYPAMCLPKR